jgi:hypothetical protein
MIAWCPIDSSFCKSNSTADLIPSFHAVNNSLFYKKEDVSFASSLETHQDMHCDWQGILLCTTSLLEFFDRRNTFQNWQCETKNKRCQVRKRPTWWKVRRHKRSTDSSDIRIWEKVPHKRRARMTEPSKNSKKWLVRFPCNVIML